MLAQSRVTHLRNSIDVEQRWGDEVHSECRMYRHATTGEPCLLWLSIRFVWHDSIIYRVDALDYVKAERYEFCAKFKYIKFFYFFLNGET